MSEFRGPRVLIRVLVAVLIAGWSASVGAGGRESFDVGSPTWCTEDRDCAQAGEGPWCRPEGLCGRCGDANDCSEPDAVCQDGACVLPCVDADDCPMFEPICDAMRGVCAECETTIDCAAPDFCAGGVCVPDVCQPGIVRCTPTARGTRACDNDGSRWLPAQACPAGEACAEIDGGAECSPSGGDTTSAARADASDSGAGAEATTEDGTTGHDGTTHATGLGGGSTVDPDPKPGCNCRASPTKLAPWLFGLLGFVAFVRRGHPSRLNHRSS